MPEKYFEKKKELWMAFIDLKKAFDREVIWWVGFERVRGREKADLGDKVNV